jgi:hypothetical protein
MNRPSTGGTQGHSHSGAVVWESSQSTIFFEFLEQDTSGPGKTRPDATSMGYHGGEPCLGASGYVRYSSGSDQSTRRRRSAGHNVCYRRYSI